MQYKDVFAVLCPDGALKFDDMKQCQSEKWVPIATYRKGEEIVVLCFTDPEVARKFAKRNYPKDWTKGVIALSLKELQWIHRKGWSVEILSFPNLFKDREGFGYEVLEFQSEPELFLRRG